MHEEKKYQVLDSAILATIIIHISVCSEFFGGTNVWSLLTYLVEFFFVIVSIRYFQQKIEANNIERLGLLYFTIIFIVSIFYNLQTTQLVSLIGRTIEITTMLMLFHLHMNNLKPFVYTVAIVLSICVYINYYYLLLDPNGIPNLQTGESFYFLGTNYNQIGIKVIIAFICSLIAMTSNILFFINLLSLAFVGINSLLIVGSMTSLICFILILFACIVPLGKFIKNIILVGLIGFIVYFQVFVVFGGDTLETSVTDSFLLLLGKDNTFTGRTQLWAASANMFWEAPLFGHGYISANDYLASEHFRGMGISPHNYIYSILHKGGIFLFVVVSMLIKKSYQEIKFYMRNDDKVAFVILISNIVLFVMMLFEVYETFYLFFLLSLMYYYPDIEESIDFN